MLPQLKSPQGAFFQERTGYSQAPLPLPYQLELYQDGNCGRFYPQMFDRRRRKIGILQPALGATAQNDQAQIRRTVATDHTQIRR